jgi:23S rRNA pseudouridine1911/1915/1917 synthase
METFHIKISAETAGQRIDKALSFHLPQFSRARLQALMEQGFVTGNDGEPADTPSRKVRAGDEFTIAVPPAEEATPKAQDIPLDIVYEDDDLLVINKSPDMVVHPAAGNHDGTLVNALLAHCGDTLSGIGGIKRPGIVHRLDKETSGLMVVAKNDAAHKGLSEQLASRKLKRVYHAIVWGIPSPAQGCVQTQIGRSKTNRQKMAVLKDGGREAITDYKTLKTFGLVASLVECRLQTGRTHQIRVHMAHKLHWLVGDPVYAKPAQASFLKLNKASEILTEHMLSFGRQALHAAELEFIHPIGKNRISLKAPQPPDMQTLLELLEKEKPR